MKTKLLIAVAALAGLAGCVAVPVEPAPVVYAAPPPVVVQPYASFGYYYRGGGGYWHRRWR